MSDSVSDALRRALKTSESSRYAISKETGITESTLSRFLHGQATITLETADRLAHILGLQLVPKKKR
jgi:plasmid maintenance system antidote protein VapI